MHTRIYPYFHKSKLVIRFVLGENFLGIGQVSLFNQACVEFDALARVQPILPGIQDNQMLALSGSFYLHLELVSALQVQMAQTGRVVRAWKDVFNDLEPLIREASLAINLLVQALISMPNCRCQCCLALVKHLVFRRNGLFLHNFTANAAYVLQV